MKNISIGVIDSPGHITVYNCSTKKIDVEVSFELEEPKCSCVQFKLRGDCRHLLFAGSATKIITGKESVSDIVADDRQQWNVYTTFDGELCLVDSDAVGNLSAGTLIWKLLRGETELTTKSEGVLSGERIYKELRKAFSEKLNLMDSSVLELGNSVSPVKKASKKVSSTKTTKDWSTVSKPPVSEFWVDNAVWQQAIYCANHGVNLLLTGPSGSGKSELCYLVAKKLGIPIIAFNMGAMSEPRTSLIGNTHLSKEGTYFAKSRFVNSVTLPKGIVLLDELSRADRGAFNILLPLMDRQGYLALDESEDAAVIHKGDKVCFFATANIGMEYTGTDPLDKALRERFGHIIDMVFPPQEAEIKILLSRCDGLNMRDAGRLVKIAEAQRKMASDEEGEFTALISTRMLLAAGNQIGAGVSVTNAIKFSIENAFSSEGAEASERTKVKQIIQRIA